jgi:hypothetical protein
MSSKYPHPMSDADYSKRKSFVTKRATYAKEFLDNGPMPNPKYEDGYQYWMVEKFGDGVECKDGSYKQSLKVCGVSYDIPAITLAGREPGGTHWASAQVGPNALFQAMRSYAARVAYFDVRRDVDDDTMNESFVQDFTYERAYYVGMSPNFLPNDSKKLKGLTYKGHDYTQDLQDKGMPALVDLLEQLIKDRRAVIDKIISDSAGELNSPDLLTNPYYVGLCGQKFINFVEDTKLWEEEILPKLKTDIFVQNHIAIVNGNYGDYEEKGGGSRRKPAFSVEAGGAASKLTARTAVRES